MIQDKKQSKFTNNKQIHQTESNYFRFDESALTCSGDIQIWSFRQVSLDYNVFTHPEHNGGGLNIFRSLSDGQNRDFQRPVLDIFRRNRKWGNSEGTHVSFCRIQVTQAAHTPDYVVWLEAESQRVWYTTKFIALDFSFVWIL